MCSSPPKPSKPKPAAPVEEAEVQLGKETKPSDIRRRRAGGISSLRTGLNIGGGGRSGLATPK
ncbi:MAG: hypothetical protein V3S01_06965 [Dehalococcoidia bacterium]